MENFDKSKEKDKEKDKKNFNYYNMLIKYFYSK